MVRLTLYHLFRFIGRILSKILFRLTVTGEENLPQDGPLIVISNHFSWFEAPLILVHLPYHTQFLAAMELRRYSWFRLFAYAFEIIPIWRGQVDRDAIREASKVLADDGVIGIFPEGGVDPDLQQRVADGEVIVEVQGHISRLSGELIRARPGAAYLAVRTDARIVPVAFEGTEHALENVRHGRRTDVKMRIGPPFGPLSISSQLRGTAKREEINQLGDEMMEHLAALFPPEKRGPYA